MNKTIKVIFIFILMQFDLLLSHIQNTTKRADGSDIIWHLSEPKNTSYTLVVLSEGSYSTNLCNHVESVLRLHSKFEDLLTSRGLGLITIEKWGVSPARFAPKEFHAHNTRSQRIIDHKTVLDEICSQGLTGWNGKFVFIGGSEGGDVMIDLIINYSQRTLAGINFVGFGAHEEKNYIWQNVQQLRDEGSLVTKLAFWWTGVPKTYAEYEKQVDKMCAEPSPEKWWFGQTYYYWADAFTRKVDLEKLYSSNVPFLAITGSKDSGITSSDDFVKHAKEKNMPITYWRIDGMGHDVGKDRPDLFEKSIDWLYQLPNNK